VPPPGLGQADMEQQNDNSFMKALCEIHENPGFNRAWYTLCGTTGVPFCNAQMKPGLKLQRRNGENENTYQLSETQKEKCIYIAQMYEPTTRAGQHDLTKMKTKSNARWIPNRIFQMVSEFEKILSYTALEGVETAEEEKKREGEVFAHIKEVFQLLDDWLSRLKEHRMQARYELTFFVPIGKERRYQIKVPIKGLDSPISCLSFVKREDLHSRLIAHVDHRKKILIDGFCSLEQFQSLKSQVRPAEWAAYIGAAEEVSLMLGAGAGCKNSLLEQSLQEDNGSDEGKFYHCHFWCVHPNFIQSDTSADESAVDQSPTQRFDSKVTYPVNPSLLSLYERKEDGEELYVVPPYSSEDDLNAWITHLEKMLPRNRTEIYKDCKIKHPSLCRNCIISMYSAFAKAANPETNSPPQLGLCDRIAWGNVGKSVKSVTTALKGCAFAILMLSKLEWAERQASAWGKEFHYKDGVDHKDLVNELKKCHHASDARRLARRLQNTFFSDYNRSVGLLDATALNSAGEFYSAETV